MARYSELQGKALIEQARRRCMKPDGFQFFVNNVFSASFEEFVTGEYIDTVTARMQSNKWTMDISARDHFKSTRLYAEIMFDIFTATKNIEGHYFSYQAGMSAYHLAKAKAMILENPYFVFHQNLNRMAASTIDFYNGRARVHFVPEGLLSFKRGIHADRIYVDDPLKDPENKLAPTVVMKINNVIKLEILAMVNRGGVCRIVGTPQTYADFFFDEGLRGRFSVWIADAMKDEANRVALFPEWKSFEELEEIRSIMGEREFNQEYRAKPAYSEDSFITRKNLLKVVNTTLGQATAYEGNSDIVAGYDIGKKAHPAHFAIFERYRIPDTDKWFYKQLHSKWFDNIDYKDQVEYINWATDAFGIDILRYDNTRGEFEAFAEQGMLPDCAEPVILNLKNNNSMAINMDTIIAEERIEFINDTRQIDQILQVNNNLQAVESAMGHGDSFWSNALALVETPTREYQVRSL